MCKKFEIIKITLINYIFKYKELFKSRKNYNTKLWGTKNIKIKRVNDSQIFQ